MSEVKPHWDFNMEYEEIHIESEEVIAKGPRRKEWQIEFGESVKIGCTRKIATKKEQLQVGTEIYITDEDGESCYTVTEIDGDKGRASRNSALHCSLEYGKDKRQCWVCTGLIVWCLPLNYGEIMKSRAGFVSNSSSSSFVMITSKDNHDKVVASFTPEERELLKIWFRYTLEEEGELFGVKTVNLAYMTGNMGDYLYDNIHEDKEFQRLAENEDEDTLYDEIRDLANTYETEVQKAKGQYFEYSADC